MRQIDIRPMYSWTMQESGAIRTQTWNKCRMRRTTPTDRGDGDGTAGGSTTDRHNGREGGRNNEAACHLYEAQLHEGSYLHASYQVFSYRPCWQSVSSPLTVFDHTNNIQTSP